LKVLVAEQGVAKWAGDPSLEVSVTWEFVVLGAIPICGKMGRLMDFRIIYRRGYWYY